MNDRYNDMFTIRGFNKLRPLINGAIQKNPHKYPLHGEQANISHYIRLAIIKQLIDDGHDFKNADQDE